MTVEAIRGFLDRDGWSSTGSGHYLHKPTGNTISASEFSDREKLLRAVFQIYLGTAQEILRKIPRFRQGLPSREVWKAHGSQKGYWLIQRTGADGAAIVRLDLDQKHPAIIFEFAGLLSSRITDEDLARGCRTWPCTSAGDRVPYPHAD